MGSGDLVRRMYSDFRGVDFRESAVDPRRSPDALNMWKDYKKPFGIRKRPYMREKYRPPATTPGTNPEYEYNAGDGNIRSVDFFNINGTTETLVVSGINLYKYEITGQGAKRTLLLSQFSQPDPTRVNTFIFNNVWYLKGWHYFLQYDGTEAKHVEGYVPTTSIGRKPAGGGAIHEDVNLLTGRRKNTFMGDGESIFFYLDTDNLDTSFTPIVTINGEVVENALASPAWGSPGGNRIRLAEAPPEPLTAGQDNVCIEFSVSDENEYPHRAIDKITRCRFATVFDNRVFYSGNPEYPNTVWHSALNDPTYVSDLDYYIEGQDNVPIKAMVPGNNRLWVFKEPSPEGNSIYYHIPTFDAEYGKIYPSTHSNIGTGCVATGTNFNDDIVFFSEKGMEGISGEVTLEQVVAHRSSLVDKKLIAEDGYKDMILAEWEGYLLAIMGNRIYLADSRAMHQIENHYEYEWFVWELGSSYTVTCASVYDGVLYLGCSDGCVYTLDGDETSYARYDVVNIYWTTPLDKFDHPQFLKTTNKRGCVIEAEGRFHIYVKTNKTDWEYIGSGTDVEDYLVSRIKRKKFKDVQLKFQHSDRGWTEEFVLESVTLECYIGGYIKR